MEGSTGPVVSTTWGAEWGILPVHPRDGPAHLCRTSSAGQGVKPKGFLVCISPAGAVTPGRCSARERGERGLVSTSGSKGKDPLGLWRVTRHMLLKGGASIIHFGIRADPGMMLYAEYEHSELFYLPLPETPHFKHSSIFNSNEKKPFYKLNRINNTTRLSESGFCKQWFRLNFEKKACSPSIQVTLQKRLRETGSSESVVL